MSSFLLWIEKSLFWAETLQGYQCPPRLPAADRPLTRERRGFERRRQLSSGYAMETAGNRA